MTFFLPSPFPPSPFAFRRINHPACSCYTSSFCIVTPGMRPGCPPDTWPSKLLFGVCSQAMPQWIHSGLPVAGGDFEIPVEPNIRILPPPAKRLRKELAQNIFKGNLAGKEKSVHYCHWKNIVWKTFLASKQNLSRLVVDTKTLNKTKETVSITEIPLGPPLLSPKESSSPEQGGVWLLFPKFGGRLWQNYGLPRDQVPKNYFA